MTLEMRGTGEHDLTLERRISIDASPGRVFAYVDDIRNLARHMSEQGSMAMMGSRLNLEIVTPNATGVGATYRYSGRMMGLTLDFSETVTRYTLEREKVWQTIGDPKLLIIAAYEMRVAVEPLSEARTAMTIAICYNLPRRGVWRLIGRLLAPVYARWCLDNMIQGAKRDLERRQP